MTTGEFLNSSQDCGFTILWRIQKYAHVPFPISKTISKSADIGDNYTQVIFLKFLFCWVQFKLDLHHPQIRDEKKMWSTSVDIYGGINELSLKLGFTHNVLLMFDWITECSDPSEVILQGCISAHSHKRAESVLTLLTKNS